MPAPDAYPGLIVHNHSMNNEDLSEQLIDLIQRVAARGPDAQAALKQVYDLSSGRLYGLALRVVRNGEWAEDVLQEAYLTVWRVAADYRASLSPPMAWMGLIVRSRALDLLRRQATQQVGRTQSLDDEHHDTLASDAATPLDELQGSETAWALHECLRKLENRQREVVSLAYLRDLSHSELAEQLKLPLGTVKTWIRRGLDQLRTCMARFA
jgi:RNA polymerase sigma-70 factor (ECF subfamily)